jgi:hypothetical protein
MIDDVTLSGLLLLLGVILWRSAFPQPRAPRPKKVKAPRAPCFSLETGEGARRFDEECARRIDTKNRRLCPACQIVSIGDPWYCLNRKCGQFRLFRCGSCSTLTDAYGRCPRCRLDVKKD